MIEFQFNKYLRDIENNMIKERRYIEFPNPSEEVIKKFLRDQNKWNYDQQVTIIIITFSRPNI